MFFRCTQLELCSNADAVPREGWEGFHFEKNLQRWQDQQEGFSEAGPRRKLYPPTHNLWEIDGDAWRCQPERPLRGRRGRNARRSAPVASLTELGEGREPLRDWSADMTP